MLYNSLLNILWILGFKYRLLLLLLIIGDILDCSKFNYKVILNIPTFSMGLSLNIFNKIRLLIQRHVIVAKNE